MEFQTILINILLAGLIFFLFVTMAINFQSENETDVSILNDPIINKAFGNISQQLNQSSETATAQKDAFLKEPKQSTFSAAFFMLSSIVNAGGVYIGVAINMLNAIFVLASESLGVPSIVLGVIMAILTLILILGVWRLLKAGE